MSIGPIKWHQRWLDVVFLHWSIPVAELRPLVPAHLELDTHDGVGWVSLVAFRLQGRPWWLPFYAGLGNTNEVNFRTYVRCEGSPGVYFLSMHAHSRLAVWVARLVTPFPYQHGRVAYARAGDEYRFTEGQAPDPLRFRPVGAAHEPAAGSLDEWLTERYAAFTDKRDGSIVAAPVTHPRWHLQGVELLDAGARRGPWWRLAPARPPNMLHFSPGVEAKFGPFRVAFRSAKGR